MAGAFFYPRGYFDSYKPTVVRNSWCGESLEKSLVVPDSVGKATMIMEVKRNMADPLLVVKAASWDKVPPEVGITSNGCEVIQYYVNGPKVAAFVSGTMVATSDCTKEAIVAEIPAVVQQETRGSHSFTCFKGGLDSSIQRKGSIAHIKEDPVAISEWLKMSLFSIITWPFLPKGAQPIKTDDLKEHISLIWGLSSWKRVSLG